MNKETDAFKVWFSTFATKERVSNYYVCLFSTHIIHRYGTNLITCTVELALPAEGKLQQTVDKVNNIKRTNFGIEFWLFLFFVNDQHLFLIHIYRFYTACEGISRRFSGKQRYKQKKVHHHTDNQQNFKLPRPGCKLSIVLLFYGPAFDTIGPNSAFFVTHKKKNCFSVVEMTE